MIGMLSIAFGLALPILMARLLLDLKSGGNVGEFLRGKRDKVNGDEIRDAAAHRGDSHWRAVALAKKILGPLRAR